MAYKSAYAQQGGGGGDYISQLLKLLLSGETDEEKQLKEIQLASAGFSLISQKANMQNRNMETVNVYAGKIDTNWDSVNLAERKGDIDAFHQKIKKSPLYDPVIEDHINVIQSQIDDRMSINNKFNLDIDRLKNIDSQLISMADDYIKAYDKREALDIEGWDAKADAELMVIADSIKKITIDRADASLSMQTGDPRRWENSSELQYLDGNAKKNTSYLISAINNDGFIDSYEYGKFMESIDTDDSRSVVSAMNKRDAELLELGKGNIVDLQNLAIETNALYQGWQDAIDNKYKGEALQSLDDDFHQSLSKLMRKKNLVGKGSGVGLEEEIWDSIYPDGVPWATFLKEGKKDILRKKKKAGEFVELPEVDIDRFKKGFKEYINMDFRGNLPGGKKPSFKQHDKIIFKEFEEAKNRNDSITMEDFISHRADIYNKWEKKDNAYKKSQEEGGVKRLKAGRLTEKELKLWRKDLGRLKDNSMRKFFWHQGTFSGSSKRDYKNIIKKLNGETVSFHLKRNEEGRLDISKQIQNVYTGTFGSMMESSVEEFNKSI